MYTCCDAPSSQCLLEGWHCFGARWSARWSRFEEHCGTAAWDDSATGAWTVGVASNPPEKKKRYSEVSGFSIGKMHKTSLHVLFEKGCWTLNIYIYATNISKTHGIQQAVKGYRDFIDEATMLGHHVSQHWNLDISFPMKIIKCLEIHA